MLFWMSFVYALAFTIIHICTKYLFFVKHGERNYFLSVSGGIAVSYVFIHLLPELNSHQRIIEDSNTFEGLKFLENHAFIMALCGLVIFYGLERMVKNAKKGDKESKKGISYTGVFWIHISFFFVYNALIGYLLIREHYENGSGMFFYFLALAVHFMTNDHSLRSEHKQVYDKYGRWLLSGAILIGWILGVVTKVDELIISLLVAFLAGGITLNVLKEELPEEKDSSFVAFSIGILGYTSLLLLVN